MPTETTETTRTVSEMEDLKEDGDAITTIIFAKGVTQFTMVIKDMKIFPKVKKIVFTDLENIVLKYKPGDPYFSSRFPNLECVEFPELKSIPSDLLRGSKRLISVNIPEVTSVGIAAFQGCEKLKCIDLPKVEEISDKAFLGCRNLEIVVATQVKKLGYAVFAQCGLTKIDLPEVTSVGVAVFQSCKKLKDIYLPKVQEIGGYAFADCNIQTKVHGLRGRRIKHGPNLTKRCFDAAPASERIKPVVPERYIQKKPLPTNPQRRIPPKTR